MAQGWIGGTLWGVLAAGFGLMVVSQIAPPPGPRARSPEAAALAPAGSEAAAPGLPDPARAAAPAAPAAPDPQPAEAAGAVPEDPASAAALPVPEENASVAATVAEASRAATPAAPKGAGTAEAATAPAPAAPSAPSAPSADMAAAAAPLQSGSRPSILKRPEPLPVAPALAAKAPMVPTAPLPRLSEAAGRQVQPPRVVAALPPGNAAPVPPMTAPALPARALPPDPAVRPSAVTLAGEVPAAPALPGPGARATQVVTAPPPQASLTPQAGDSESAPAAMARSGFQPDLIAAPPPPPVMAEVAPGTGALPPPPPLTAAELAILAEAGAATEEPGLPEVVVLTEAADPAQPSIMKKPAPLVPAPSFAAEGKVPASEGLPLTGTVADPAKAAAAAETAAPPAADAPPLVRHARPFQNAAGKPLFAIVLIDTGDPRIDRQALATMPFPVTFALDPSRPESALAASIYRAAGQEVVMLASGLPSGATAADVEVSFGAHQAVLPESVAVLDPEAGGFQGDRALASLVVPVVAGQGRGLLSWDRGLNAAAQVAQREGLASGVIFRRLDGEGEPVAQMRRYLDRAAFKAAQDGRVIVAGETQANTVAALLEWAVEGRASTVALAPVSAALRVE